MVKLCFENKDVTRWSTYSTLPLTSKSLANVTASQMDDRIGALVTNLPSSFL